MIPSNSRYLMTSVGIHAAAVGLLVFAPALSSRTVQDAPSPILEIIPDNLRLTDGNTIGGGSGRALATAAGVIGGAMFGNSIEAAPPPIARQVTNCTTQMSYENRITAYNVVYDYGGKQYSIQLPNDPGPYLPVQVTPSVLAAPPVTSTTIISPPPLVTLPTFVTSVYTPPIYAAPLYGPPMYPAPGLSFQFSYGHHWHDHDHRRWH